MTKKLERRLSKIKSTLPIGYDAAIVRCVCGEVIEVNIPRRCPKCNFIIWIGHNHSGFIPWVEAPEGFTKAGINALKYSAPIILDWV